MLDLGLGLKRIAHPSLSIERLPEFKIEVRGEFTLWMTRVKSGSMVRKPWKIKNGAATVGLNYVLNTAFRSVAQLTTWYCGILAGSGFTGVSVNDTMSSHSGWSELTGYSESVRQTWSPGAAASGVVINSTAMAFTINANSTAQGVFIASDSAKSGSSGTLWATAAEASPFSVTSGVALNVIYQITLTPVS